jgi:hypothetical protein
MSDEAPVNTGHVVRDHAATEDVSIPVAATLPPQERANVLSEHFIEVLRPTVWATSSETQDSKACPGIEHPNRTEYRRGR